jgi:putative transposase
MRGLLWSIKDEMFYAESWEGVSLEESIDELNGFLRWHNESRIKMTLEAMSSLDYRQSLRLVA